ncbi:MAG: PEPxxWA-CTERM sorting domain-containing protein [Sphingomonadaceae bacterium]
MFRSVILLAFVAWAGVAHASAIIAENLDGTEISNPLFAWGQSFTTPAGPGWNQISVNFYSDPGVPVAAGTGYLFLSAYTGTPNQLSASTPLATATSNGSVWTFPTSLVLAGSTQYFFYSDAFINRIIGNQDSYAGGSYFGNDFNNLDSPFVDMAPRSINFTVAGVAVPEPSTWLLLIAGFGLIGHRLRRAPRAAAA